MDEKIQALLGSGSTGARPSCVLNLDHQNFIIVTRILITTDFDERTYFSPRDGFGWRPNG